MGARQNLENNFDFEIVDEFLDHYGIMLELLEPLIAKLDKEDNYHENLNELFRIFHNLKSASGFLKIEPISRLTSFVENYLDTLRSYPEMASEEVITWLFKIHDMLLVWHDDLQLDKKLSKIDFSLLKLPDNG